MRSSNSFISTVWLFSMSAALMIDSGDGESAGELLM